MPSEGGPGGQGVQASQGSHHESPVRRWIGDKRRSLVSVMFRFMAEENSGSCGGRGGHRRRPVRAMSTSLSSASSVTAPAFRSHPSSPSVSKRPSVAVTGVVQGAAVPLADERRKGRGSHAGSVEREVGVP